MLPGLLLAAAFVIYPMLFNIRISFSEYNIVQRTITWTGLDNLNALFNDSQSRLLVAIRNNYLYALVTTPFILLFGVLFAVMINNLRRGRILFRTFFYLPVITSWVIVGMVFTYMFNSSERGLVNYLLVDFLPYIGRLRAMAQAHLDGEQRHLADGHLEKRRLGDDHLSGGAAEHLAAAVRGCRASKAPVPPRSFGISRYRF